MIIEEIEKFVRNKSPDFFVEHHIKTVVSESLKLSEKYPEADKEILEVAAWLHDVGHDFEKCGNTKAYIDERSHHIRSAELTKEFLTKINFSKEKIDKIIHCIESHRTRTPPEPKTIEAKIVASADNLSHFIEVDTLFKKLGAAEGFAKLKRDLKADFMLPEALEKANEIMKEIKDKRGSDK